MSQSNLPKVDEKTDRRDLRNPAGGNTVGVLTELPAATGWAAHHSDIATVTSRAADRIEGFPPWAVSTVRAPRAGQFFTGQAKHGLGSFHPRERGYAKWGQVARERESHGR